MFWSDVDEVFYSLLLATSVNDDPVSLLKAAGRDHIPVNPSESLYREEMINVEVPTSNKRLSIAEVVAELQTQTWVDDQIVYMKAFDAKEALTGKQMTHISPPCN